MSATLWIDSGSDRAVNLGGALRLYSSFQEMAKVAGDGWLTDWPALFSVCSAVENGDDVPADWLADLKAEAARFQARHGDQLSVEADNLLTVLRAAGA